MDLNKIYLIIGIVGGVCVTIAYFKGFVSWLLKVLGINKDDIPKQERMNHDNNILKEIFSLLLPYEKFKTFCEIAHYHGAEEEFLNSLGEISKYIEAPYKLYSKNCEKKKQELLSAIEEFRISLAVAVIYNEKLKRYTLPFEYKGTDKEHIYRNFQKEINEKAQIVIKTHDDFILAVKKDDLRYV